MQSRRIILSSAIALSFLDFTRTPAHAAPLFDSVTASSVDVAQGGTISIAEQFENSPPGPLNYDTYANFPYGQSPTQSGFTLGPATANFSFDSSLTDFGAATITLTVVDNSNSEFSSNSFTVEVLHHSTPNLYVNNNVTSLKSPGVVPIAAQYLGSNAGGIHATSITSPVILNMPHTGSDTADLVLNSITSTGASNISLLYTPNTSGISASDNPSDGIPFTIDVDAPPGDYSTLFTLNYSDQSGLAGGYTSEQQSFTIDADVTAAGASFDIITAPEPTALSILLISGTLTLLTRRLRKTNPVAAKV